MNKTDMSNPDQCSLSGSLCCTKEADKLRHAMKGWVEMSGREARERGGGGERRRGEEAYPSQDLQRCSQSRQSLGALNHRRTVNH